MFGKVTWFKKVVTLKTKKMPRATRQKTRKEPVEQLVIGLLDELKEMRNDIDRITKQQNQDNVSESSSGANRPGPSSGANMPGPSSGALIPLITGGELARGGEEVNNYAFAPPRNATSTVSSAGYGPNAQSSVMSHPVMLSPPTPSSALPDIEIVPANVRKDIVQGKDVNLAILLLPIKDRKNITGDRDIQIGEEVFSLKGGRDNRLSRDLTISEFITAFNVYKRVMCTHYPHRRDELDTYIGQIIEISNRFPGFGFY